MQDKNETSQQAKLSRNNSFISNRSYKEKKPLKPMNPRRSGSRSKFKLPNRGNSNSKPKNILKLPPMKQNRIEQKDDNQSVNISHNNSLNNSFNSMISNPEFNTGMEEIKDDDLEELFQTSLSNIKKVRSIISDLNQVTQNNPRKKNHIKIKKSNRSFKRPNINQKPGNDLKVVGKGKSKK